MTIALPTTSAANGVPGFFLAKPLRAERGVVTRIFTSWNEIGEWLRQLEALQHAA